MEEKKKESRLTRDERASLRTTQADLSKNQEDAEITSLQSKLARGRKKAENDNLPEKTQRENESMCIANNSWISQLLLSR